MIELDYGDNQNGKSSEQSELLSNKPVDVSPTDSPAPRNPFSHVILTPEEESSFPKKSLFEKLFEDKGESGLDLYLSGIGVNNEFSLPDFAGPREPVSFYENDALDIEFARQRQAKNTLRFVGDVSRQDAVDAFHLARERGLPEEAIFSEGSHFATETLRELDLARIQSLDPAVQEALGNVGVAARVKEELSGFQRFKQILSAPSDFFRRGLDTLIRAELPFERSVGEAFMVLPRAPFNIAESSYQGVQALGGLMQQVGLRGAGEAVEKWGRRQADVSRKFLKALEPYPDSITNQDILKDPSLLLSDAGLAWLIRSTGDTGARQIPAIAGYMASPVLGGLIGGGQEGAAFFEQLRRDGVDLESAFLQGLSFGMATGLLERIGLDATLPAYAPRTANHLLDRAMGVVGKQIDKAVGRLPARVQPVINFGRAGAVEGLTEYVENPIQGALEGVAKKESGLEIAERTLEGFEDWTVILPAFLLGGGLRAAGGGTRAFSREEVEAGKSVQDENAAADVSEESDALPRESERKNADTVVAQRQAEENRADMASAFTEIARFEQAANDRLIMGERLEEAVRELDQLSTLKVDDPAAFADAYGRLVPEELRTVYLAPDLVRRYGLGDPLEDLETTGEGEAPTAETVLVSGFTTQLLMEEQTARMQRLGITPEALGTALASGATVPVPTINLLALPPTEARNTLLRQARLEPDGLSGPEAQRVQPGVQLDEAAKRINQAQQAREARYKQERRLAGEMTAAGYPAHVAADYAALLRANAEAFQNAYDADAVQLLEAIGVRQAEGGEQGQRGQVRFVRTPEGEARALIEVFPGKDLSTVVHEGSHIWTRQLEEIALNRDELNRKRLAEETKGMEEYPEELTSLIDRAESLINSEEQVASMARKARDIQAHAHYLGDLELERQARSVSIALYAVRRNIARLDKANEDLKKLRRYAEVNENEVLSEENQKKFYERVASGMEAYFMEGKAPTQKLQRVFNNLRKWFTAIYQNVRNIFARAEYGGVPLTDEVRSVFDRMLSNDELLSADRRRQDLRDGAESLNASLEEAGISIEELNELTELLNEADQQTLMRMDMLTLRDRRKRELQARKTAEGIVNNDPFWDVVDYLRKVGIDSSYISREFGGDALKDFRRFQASMLRAKGGVPLDVVATELGYADGDSLWNDLYDRLIVKGKTRAREIRDVARQMIDEEDARLLAERGDEGVAGDAYGAYLDQMDQTLNRMLGTSRGISDQALAAFVARAATPRSIIRDRAARQLAEMKLEDIQPHRFSAAVRKQQREVAEHLRRRDLASALQALDAARLANELDFQGRNIRKSLEKSEERARKMGQIKPDVIDPAAREGLRRLLQRFGLANVSLAPYSPAVGQLSMRDIVTRLSPDMGIMQEEKDGAAQGASGVDLVLSSFSDWVLDENGVPDGRMKPEGGVLRHQELTQEQFKDVENLLKYLEHRGREEARDSKDSMWARITETAIECAQPMSSLKSQPILAEDAPFRKLRSFWGGVLAEFDNLRSTFFRADGFSSLKDSIGPNERLLLQPLLEAENRKKILWKDLSEKLAPHIEQLTDCIVRLNKAYGEKLGSLKLPDGKPLDIPPVMQENGRAWTPERVLGMALQLGNAGNASRLVAGFSMPTESGQPLTVLDPVTVARLLGEKATRHLFQAYDPDFILPASAVGEQGVLTESDWKAIQGIWDALESQWSDIAEAHEKLMGFAPEKVQATPFVASSENGTDVAMSGGYLPIKYDRLLGEKSANLSEKENLLESTMASFAPPSAKRTFTKARGNKGLGEPVRLDLKQIMDHLEDTTTFIALGPVVREIDRVTRQPEWKSEYIRVFGREEYQAIRANLKGLVRKEGDFTRLDTIARYARTYVTYNALSWNLNTMFMQTDALFKAAADNGWRSVLYGTKKMFSQDPKRILKDIFSVSPYMESRSKNIQRDLGKTVVDISKMAKEKGYSLLSFGKLSMTAEQFAELGMKPMQAIDMVVSGSIWIGAYKEKMKQLGEETDTVSPNLKNHDKAVAYADLAVKKSNPDYDSSSISIFQRRSNYNLVNMFASATTLIYQRQRLRYQALKHGKIRLPEYAAWQVMDSLLPATAYYIFSEACIAAFGDDEKKKKHEKKGWLQRYLEQAVDYISPSIPGGGIATSVLIDGHPSQGRVQTVFDSPVRIAKKVKSALFADEKNKKRSRKRKDEHELMNAIVDAIGFATKIPTQRFKKYSENVGNVFE